MKQAKKSPRRRLNLFGPRHPVIEQLWRRATRAFKRQQLADMLNGCIPVPRSERMIREYLSESARFLRPGRQSPRRRSL